MQRAIAPHRKPLVEIGQTHEDDREQGFAVPRVVEQDVEMVERVLVQQVRLVDEQDREGALSGEVLDVAGDGEKDIARG